MYHTHRIERRRYQRLHVSLSALCRIAGPAKLLYLLEGKEFEANVVNLSSGGAALEIPYELPSETRLFMKMIIFEADHHGRACFYEVLTLFANVCYCKKHENGRMRIGTIFTDMDSDRERVLENLMRSSFKRETGPANRVPTILFSE